MKLWKIEEGRFVKPPEGMSEEESLSDGYKPIEWNKQPEAEEGWHYEASWVESAEAFVQIWTKVEGEPDVPLDEFVAILLGGAT